MEGCTSQRCYWINQEQTAVPSTTVPRKTYTFTTNLWYINLLEMILSLLTWYLTYGIGHQCHQQDELPQLKILHDKGITPQAYTSLRPERDVGWLILSSHMQFSTMWKHHKEDHRVVWQLLWHRSHYLLYFFIGNISTRSCYHCVNSCSFKKEKGILLHTIH